MKHLLLFCFALLTLQTSSAQGQFAPVGAEWWHQGKDWEFINFGHMIKVWADHTVVTGDTTIDDIVARKVFTTRYAKNRSAPTETYRIDSFLFCVYDTPDTVFVYDTTRTAFLPLFIYNVDEGDTVTLLAPLTNPVFGDIEFTFVVDSIRMETFDTAHLKSYYTRTLGNEEETSSSYNWGKIIWGDVGPSLLGKYTQTLGGTYGNVASILPLRSGYNVDASTSDELPSGKLACYSDAHYNLKMVDIACDSIENFPITSTKDMKLLTDISIYPNPATDIINVAALNELPAHITATLFDISGRMLLSAQLSGGGNTEINIAHLPKGLYLMRINANGQTPVHRKIVLR